MKKHASCAALLRGIALSLPGCLIGILSLALTADAYQAIDQTAVFLSYFKNPSILFLNLFPPVVFFWLFAFLSSRTWLGYTLSYLLTIGLSLVNYFKISLRSDPLMAIDVLTAGEAGNVFQNYAITITPLVLGSIIGLAAGLLLFRIYVPRFQYSLKKRLAGFLLCAACLTASLPLLYVNANVYALTENTRYIVEWSEVEQYISRGCVYSFLNSTKNLRPVKPEGYDQELAKATLSRYADSDIPQAQQVSVVGIMLEAFCDLTDFSAFSAYDEIQAIYAPWHELEAQSIRGNLITNIFAGGTANTEWGFLTGDAQYAIHRKNTDSYVWYFKNQGYQTFGYHLYHAWFYNRLNVNRYLGFDDYKFFSDLFSPETDAYSMFRNSDQTLIDHLTADLSARLEDGPCFSFSVSVQNHGPYDASQNLALSVLDPEGAGLSAETCHIFNNYLSSLSNTIEVMTGLAQTLDAWQEPIVLVLFGDHKPWGGNNNSAYAELGVSFDLSTTAGIYNYYSTPYLIWANSAAKSVLKNDFIGDGGDFSPCFLMAEVFDQCGWEGPGFMQLSRELRSVSPVVHQEPFFLKDGAFVRSLPEEDDAFYRQYLSAQFYRRNQIHPALE